MGVGLGGMGCDDLMAFTDMFQKGLNNTRRHAAVAEVNPVCVLWAHFDLYSPLIRLMNRGSCPGQLKSLMNKHTRCVLWPRCFLSLHTLVKLLMNSCRVVKSFQ